MGDLNNKHAVFPSVTDRWSLQDHLPSILLTQKALSPRKPQQ